RLQRCWLSAGEFPAQPTLVEIPLLLAGTPSPLALGPSPRSTRPPPARGLVGEGRGGGDGRTSAEESPPTPNPSPQGGRESSCGPHRRPAPSRGQARDCGAQRRGSTSPARGAGDAGSLARPRPCVRSPP